MGRCIVLLLVVLCSIANAAEPGRAGEYQVKAVFLLNFAKFVDWPAAAFADPNAPFRIGVLGNDPFGTSMDAVVRDETVQGRPLAVVRSQKPSDLTACQLIFVSASERDKVASILGALDHFPILIVGDDGAFAEQGGVIGFILDDDHVRFAINTTSARERRLKISAQLLRLGRLVSGGTDGG